MPDPILVSAGEPSGDLHAAALVRELRRQSRDRFTFFGLGGPHLAAEGVRLLHSFQAFSVVGFQEGIFHFRQLHRVLKDLVRAARHVRLAILVDFPGFHLWLARFLKAQGIPVVYYIVPQVWAWWGWRVRWLKRYTDLCLVILPFEAPLLRAYGIRAHFVGHPILDRLTPPPPPLPRPSGHPVIGILPGSRKEEVQRLLPRFLRVAKILRKTYPSATFLVSQAVPTPLPQRPWLIGIADGAARILRSVDAALVASGTVSLEAGLLGVPTVVGYALSELSWWLARALAHVHHVSLVNLLLGERVLPEYVQHMPPEAMAQDLIRFLSDEETRRRVKEKLARLWPLLGRPGAARRAAALILEEMVCAS